MKSWQALKDKYPAQLSNCDIQLPLGWYEVIELLVLDNLECNFHTIYRELPSLEYQSSISICRLYIAGLGKFNYQVERLLNITCEECGKPGSNLIESKTLFWPTRKTGYSHNFCDKCLVDYNNMVKVSQL